MRQPGNQSSTAGPNKTNVVPIPHLEMPEPDVLPPINPLVNKAAGIVHFLQNFMSARGDFYILLRDHSPLHAITVTNMSMDFAKTKQGLFLLLIFHNISYGPQAFLQCLEDRRVVCDFIALILLYLTYSAQMWFNSLEEWNEYEQFLRAYFAVKAKRTFGNNSERFFCDYSVLGQYIEGRKLENAVSIWSKIQAENWPPVGTSTFPITFKAMLDWVNKPSTLIYSIAGFGLLSRYLWVTDLYTAGLVRPPSIEEMGDIITMLNRGAVAGQHRLEYLPSKGGNVIAVFNAFYADEYSVLISDEVQNMPWNTIVGEHTLCKYVRMAKRNV